VELDGRTDHELELGFESDRERDAELIAAGYRVIRITRRQLELDPDGVERRLRAALAYGSSARAA
jgi:very-short-patch-repair endonuclease